MGKDMKKVIGAIMIGVGIAILIGVGLAVCSAHHTTAVAPDANGTFHNCCRCVASDGRGGVVVFPCDARGRCEAEPVL